MKRIDLVGRQFGRLTVVARAANRGVRPRTMWLCRCSCGNEKVIGTDTLRQNTTSSCGCLVPEVTRQRSLKHGGSIGYRECAEYKAWQHAKARCYNPNDAKYPQYGGRGIKMCVRWLNDYAAFFADMGPRPDGCSLDRINVNGNYEPENCRWATADQQSRNRTDNVFLEFNGKQLVLRDWARELGLDKRRLHAMIRYQGKTLAEVAAQVGYGQV